MKAQSEKVQIFLKPTEFKGIISPILTPMFEDESINFNELRN